MRRDASVGVDLYGRDVSASKALKSLGQVAENTGRKIDHVANNIIRGMAAAAAATAALTIKLGVDAVKAAIEDQKSAAVLQKSLENATHATAAQTKAVEDYITAQQLRYGFEDTTLRAGMGKLVLATHDVTKAQKLLNTSMSLSRATGKDLETVSLAVSKAYAGNLGALTRLGVAIPKELIKTKDFGKVWDYVSTQVQGFADKAAATTEIRMQRVRLAFDEAKESVGYMLMEALTPYLDKLTQLIPKIQEWADVNGPKMKQALLDAMPTIKDVFDTLVNTGKWFVEHKSEVVAFGKALLAALAAEKVAASVLSIMKTLEMLRNAYLALAAGEALATGGANIYAGMAAIAAAGLAYVVADSAMGGPVTTAGRAGTGKGQTLAGTSMGQVTGQFAYGSYASASRPSSVTVNVSGSVVSEGDLIKKVRNAITQANRRQGADVTVAGLGRK